MIYSIELGMDFKIHVQHDTQQYLVAEACSQLPCTFKWVQSQHLPYLSGNDTSDADIFVVE
jgi:hypothetical protein